MYKHLFNFGAGYRFFFLYEIRKRCVASMKRQGWSKSYGLAPSVIGVEAVQHAAVKYGTV